ncbi:MAG TPA: glycosyltransferase, partial [Tepidisphaeraceae bacterium]|nr:glycosyltransferase [Tepidisphaeraceae bacterium]
MSQAIAMNQDVRPSVAAEQLVGRDMLCFSHDWSGDPLSKTHLMRLLSRNNRVLWVNSIGYRTPTVSKRDISRAFRKLAVAAQPIREPEPNIFVLSPLVIPAYGRNWVRALNRLLLQMQVKRAMRKLNFQRPINWVFNPAAAIIAGTLGEERVVYYCVDEYTALNGVSQNNIGELERQLLSRADLVIVSAERLYRVKSAIHSNTHMIRHGVDFENFRKALEPETQIPEDLRKLPRPVIGYFGLMSSDWFDVPLMAHAARSIPEASIVLIGKVTMDMSELKALPNVHILGHRPYSSLPAFAKGFDVAVIPFPISEATLNANPLKAREYLAAGLPVVSTAIPEVQALGQCLIGQDREEFVQKLRHAIQSPGARRQISESMRPHSWEA